MRLAWRAGAAVALLRTTCGFEEAAERGED